MQVDYWKFLDELDLDEALSKLETKDTAELIDEDFIRSTHFYPGYPVESEKSWNNRNYSAIGSELYKSAKCYGQTEVEEKPQTDCSADDVEHPAHYTRGRQEAIDTIEDAVIDAPDAVVGGLHWNALKYLLRLWVKDTPIKNAKKARWYLDRLISKL
jgi:hypothetical protein